jgi:two-component system nitrate/nitrite response regulator NarL
MSAAEPSRGTDGDPSGGSRTALDASAAAGAVNEAIRVVLIDDHELCRRGLSELLERRAGIKVLGTTGNADEAVRLLRDGQPDLALIDLRMAPVDGFALLARIRAEGIDTPVVVLTMSDLKDDLARAFRAGVRGYLVKNMDPEDVIDAIRRTARGEIVVAPLMAAKLVDLLVLGKERNSRDDCLKQLTEREREILEHLARGKSNKAIAQSLDISHDTVKLHVRHILSKLGLTSRVEAAVFAVEHRVSMERG